MPGPNAAVEESSRWPLWTKAHILWTESAGNHRRLAGLLKTPESCSLIVILDAADTVHEESPKQQMLGPWVLS